MQSRFTKRLSGFSKLSYDERLASLNCESLYSRCVKCDLVMRYQMLTGSVNVDTDAFFTRFYFSTNRCNYMKLLKPQFQYAMVTSSLTALLTIGIRFRIALSHHHLLLASSENSGLLIFTCNFSDMSTCNTCHLSEQDYNLIVIIVIVQPVGEDIEAHGASIRCPMRIQDDFLKLIAMSSKFSTRSQILNKLSSSQTEGANSKISSG